MQQLDPAWSGRYAETYLFAFGDRGQAGFQAASLAHLLPDLEVVDVSANIAIELGLQSLKAMLPHLSP